MKKTLVALSAALALASTGVMAQDERAGGAGTGGLATGAAGAAGFVVAGAVAAGVLAAILANSDGVTLPIDPPPPSETCEGSDPLVGGVCVGTTTTVTVTGTGTATSTITVPVTFTYAPTVN